MIRGSMSLLIVTSSRDDAERAASELRALGLDVNVLEVPDLLFTPPDVLLRALGDAPRAYDYVVLPGTYPWDLKHLGGRFVKGPEGLGLLVDVIRRYGIDVLNPTQPFEKANPDLLEALARLRLEELRARASPIPESPPPLSVLSEVPVQGGGSYDEVRERVYSVVADGADYVVLAPMGPDPSSVVKYAEELRGSLRGVRLGLDADEATLRRYAQDFDLLLSVTARGATDLTWASSREVVITVRDGDLGLVERALRACERAGARPVLDPIAMPTPRPGLLGTITRLQALSGYRAPKMIGASNVVELMDADTSGSIALLSSLAAELGVSAVMVEEASPKARGLTREARDAADMVSLSLAWGKSAKDLGVSLLNSKMKVDRSERGDLKVRAAGRTRVEVNYADLVAAVDCRDVCPLGQLTAIPDERSRTLAAVLVYRLCLPWSSAWRC